MLSMRVMRNFCANSFLSSQPQTLIANLAPADQNIFTSNPPRALLRIGSVAFNSQALMPASLVPHMQNGSPPRDAGGIGRGFRGFMEGISMLSWNF